MLRVYEDGRSVTDRTVRRKADVHTLAAEENKCGAKIGAGAFIVLHKAATLLLHHQAVEHNL